MSTAIGRRRELEQIDGVLSAAIGGQRRVLVIEGEAGIGKSKLIDDTESRAIELGCTVLHGGITSAESTLSWAGLSTLARHLPPDLIAELPEAQRAALATALGLGAADPADPMSVAAGLTTALAMLTASTPVVVLVDDLQWLDLATASALAFAIRASAGRPIAFVLATRPGVGPIEVQRLVPDAELLHLHLDGLSVAGVHRLLLERLDLQLGRTDLIRLHTAAAGNPLYAIETGRLLRAGTSFATALLPPSLQAVIAENLRMVPTTALPVLRAAALMATPLVSHLERFADASTVEHSLAAGEQADLIVVEDDVVAFRHPLLRAGLLERIGTVERRRLHRRLASLTDDPEEQAIHLAAAAVAPDDAAAEALEVAAELAEQRGASHLAAERWSRSLELTSDDDAGSCTRRRLRAASACFDNGDFGTALIHYLGVLPRLTDPERRAEAVSGIIASTAQSIGVEPALKAAAELLDEFSERPELYTRLLIPVVRLQLHVDLRQAEATALRAIAVLDGVDEPALRLSAELMLVLIGFLRSDPVDIDDAVAHVVDDRLPGSGRDPRAALGEMLVWSDRIDLALEVQELALADAEERGALVGVVNALDQLSDAHFRAGRFETAESYLTRWCNLTASAGEHVEHTPRSLDLAYIDALRGHRASAERRIADSGLGDVARVPIESAQCHARAGFVHLVHGDIEVAATCLRTARATMVEIGLLDICALPFWFDLVEALVACGALDEAASVVEEMRAAEERSGRPRAAIEAGRADALVRAARGDLPAAETSVQRALLAHEQVPLPFEHGRTLLVAGMIARRSGRRTEARERLDRARRLFDEVGAAPFVDRADAELARLGARTTETGMLTATERQIALLVAAGRTNAEVAAELFVSLRTVESNLTRLYRKLGVRSRTELARRSDLVG